MRLFRQTERSGWEPVLERVRAALVEELAGGRRGRMERSATQTGRTRGWGQSAAIQGLFHAAVGYHREGRLEEAERLYRQILAIDDRHAESLHLLGMISFKRGRYAEAVEEIGAAIAIDGGQATYYSNLGNVLRAEGKYDAAVERYRRAVELKPDFVEAHYNLGLVYQLQGRGEAAIVQFERVLALRPDFTEVLSGLG
jgi:protein O-GlcNAc transferase